MKTKLCFFSLCLISGILSFTMQGADLFDREGGAADRPKVRLRIPPVMIEIESGMIHVVFIRDLGMVNLKLQHPTGMTIANQLVDTSVRDKNSINLPAGTYFLTVFSADEAILTQVIIVVPQ